MVYNFEELVIWQIARDLTQEIYSSLSEIKDFGFRDQIQRASISIMNNIAEGFQRHKNTKDNKIKEKNFFNLKKLQKITS